MGHQHILNSQSTTAWQTALPVISVARLPQCQRGRKALFPSNYIERSVGGQKVYVSFSSYAPNLVPAEHNEAQI
jgi:hypothetical protein